MIIQKEYPGILTSLQKRFNKMFNKSYDTTKRGTKMKKVLLLTAALILAEDVAANSTHARKERVYEGPYASISIGASKAQKWHETSAVHVTKFKAGPSFRAAIGSQSQHFRAEFEPSYIRIRRNVNENGFNIAEPLRVLSVLGNFYYELPVTFNLSPYIGVGAGFSSIHEIVSRRNFKIDRSSAKFSYQAIVGALYELTDHVGLTADYRYFQTEKLNQFSSGIRNHSLNVGLRYYF